MALNLIRPIIETEFLCIRNEIAHIEFLKKYSWKKPLCEMVYEGLSKSIWKALGCFSDEMDLMSYCDYRIHNDFIEVGVCFTLKKYRGCGLAKLMLQYLISCFPDQEITIGTAESNAYMMSCILKLGFKEEFRVSNERINGDATIYYRHYPTKKGRDENVLPVE